MDSYTARITPLEGPVDPGYGRPEGGGHPSHPIEIPPLPPDAYPEHPIQLPPTGGYPSHPIVIPGTPEHPIALPPATVWPPLPPGTGIAGKVWILVWVVGVGYRWLVVQGPDIWPPTAQPK